MKTTSIKTRNIIFGLLVVYFIVLNVCLMSCWRFWGYRPPVWSIAAFIITFGIMGVILAIQTVKLKGPLVQRIFFILTGISAAAVPVCAILHNVIYGLFFHGKGGEDEVVFFVLAVLVFPALFILGSLGGIISGITGRLRKKDIAC
ncbi:MAG: hypothetical protein JW806_02760 [Sedimentisphaerales bacterium]|nr:hypothetical protein [Sedimentisphaerales bacterium]